MPGYISRIVNFVSLFNHSRVLFLYTPQTKVPIYSMISTSINDSGYFEAAFTWNVPDRSGKCPLNYIIPVIFAPMCISEVKERITCMLWYCVLNTTDSLYFRKLSLHRYLMILSHSLTLCGQHMFQHCCWYVDCISIILICVNVSAVGNKCSKSMHDRITNNFKCQWFVDICISLP